METKYTATFSGKRGNEERKLYKAASDYALDMEGRFYEINDLNDADGSMFIDADKGLAFREAEDESFVSDWAISVETNDGIRWINQVDYEDEVIDSVSEMEAVLQSEGVDYVVAGFNGNTIIVDDYYSVKHLF